MRVDSKGVRPIGFMDFPFMFFFYKVFMHFEILGIMYNSS